MSQYNTGNKKEQDNFPQLVERIAKHNERKRLAQALGDLYFSIPDHRISRYGGLIKGCCETMIIRRYETAENEIAYAMFCGARLCPICSHRRSIKAFVQLSKILDEADRLRVSQSGKPYEYILITLTMQNVGIEAIDEALQRLIDSTTKLTRSKMWRDAIKGAWRSLEITFNSKTLTYHPHIHLFCAVNPSYFTSKNYISQEKLKAAWKKIGKFPYDPIVDIRRIKTELESGMSRNKAKAEVSKYLTKQSNFLLEMPKVDAQAHLAELTYSLQNKKQFICYGIIREVQRLLNLSDEDGDLNNILEDDDAIAKQLRPDVKYVYDLLYFSEYLGAYKKAMFTDSEIFGAANLCSSVHFMKDKLQELEQEEFQMRKALEKEQLTADEKEQLTADEKEQLTADEKEDSLFPEEQDPPEQESFC